MTWLVSFWCCAQAKFSDKTQLVFRNGTVSFGDKNNSWRSYDLATLLEGDKGKSKDSVSIVKRLRYVKEHTEELLNDDGLSRKHAHSSRGSKSDHASVTSTTTSATNGSDAAAKHDREGITHAQAQPKPSAPPSRERRDSTDIGARPPAKPAATARSNGISQQTAQTAAAPQPRARVPVATTAASAAYVDPFATARDR